MTTAPDSNNSFRDSPRCLKRLSCVPSRDRRALLNNIILFLVEKSPVNINCLFACLIDCLCVSRVKKTSKTDFEVKTFLEVIRCGEFEYAVAFN